jgi:hypothetical protein
VKSKNRASAMTSTTMRLRSTGFFLVSEYSASR